MLEAIIALTLLALVFAGIWIVGFVMFTFVRPYIDIPMPACSKICGRSVRCCRRSKATCWPSRAASITGTAVIAIAASAARRR